MRVRQIKQDNSMTRNPSRIKIGDIVYIKDLSQEDGRQREKKRFKKAIVDEIHSNYIRLKFTVKGNEIYECFGWNDFNLSLKR